jgi:hypothetical protein
VDIVIYIILLTTLQTMVKTATPPEGYVFERLPALVGVYSCCGSNSNYPTSKVGIVSLNCSEPDFMNHIGASHKYGTDMFSCGLEHELNGQTVEVIRAMTPTVQFLEAGAVVTRISSNGQIFYERSDKTLRDQWIKTSYPSVISVAQMICMFLGLILVLIFANPKKLGESDG